MGFLTMNWRHIASASAPSPQQTCLPLRGSISIRPMRRLLSWAIVGRLAIRPVFSARSRNTVQSLSERSAGEPTRGEESQRHEAVASTSPGAHRAHRNAPWGISFVLFLVGFVLLVVLARLNLSRLTTDVMRGVAAGLCVAAFVIARRGQRV